MVQYWYSTEGINPYRLYRPPCGGFGVGPYGGSHQHRQLPTGIQYSTVHVHYVVVCWYGRYRHRPVVWSAVVTTDGAVRRVGRCDGASHGVSV